MDETMLRRIEPHFCITVENELLFEWRNGDRHLTLYINPPDNEEGPIDCFGSTGPFDPMSDFDSIHEGYCWLLGEEAADAPE